MKLQDHFGDGHTDGIPIRCIKFIFKHKSVALFSFGLLLNVTVLVDYRKSPFATFLLWDSAHYWEWALRIAGGDWIGTTVFHQPPLYAYLLAFFITVFGENTMPVYLFQAVLSAVTAAMVCRLTVKCTGSGMTGIVAGFLYVFYGIQVFYTFKILSECVAAFLLVLTAWLLLSENFRSRTVAAGAVAGAVLLVKPQFLMAIPLLAGCFFMRKPYSVAASLKQVIPFLLACGAVVSITAVRNYAVAKEPVLVSGNGGENFYLGNNARANGSYTPAKGISSDIAFQNEDVIARAEEMHGKKMDRSGISRYWYKKAFDWIRRHPSGYIRLELTKLLNIFSGTERSNMYLLSFERKEITKTFNYAFVNFYLLFPLFCAGFIVVIGNWRCFYPVAIPLLANGATIMLFFYDERFRVVTMPLFIIVCGAGIVRLAILFTAKSPVGVKARQHVSILFVAGLVLLAALLYRDRRYPSQEWRMQMALGDIAYGKGEVDASLDYYIKASELNKTECIPAFMVSKVIFAKGYRDVAVELYLKMIKTVSDDDRETILRDRDFNQLREYLKSADDGKGKK